RSRCRAGLPPFAHDGTERRIVRPQDPVEQTDCYSGKKKDHTVKNVLLVNALLLILFLSETYGGRVHDLRIAEATPYPLPAGSGLLQDLGFLSFTLPEVEMLMPMRKPRGAELTLAQQEANQALHQRRLRIEHVNSSVKRCRIVKDRIRLWKEGVRDVVIEICCALHKPTVCIGVTYEVACTYGCGDGRIWLPRCAVIVAVLGGRCTPLPACSTPPAEADSVHSALAAGSGRAAPADLGGAL